LRHWCCSAEGPGNANLFSGTARPCRKRIGDKRAFSICEIVSKKKAPRFPWFATAAELWLVGPATPRLCGQRYGGISLSERHSVQELLRSRQRHRRAVEAGNTGAAEEPGRAGCSLRDSAIGKDALAPRAPLPRALLRLAGTEPCLNPPKLKASRYLSRQTKITGIGKPVGRSLSERNNCRPGIRLNSRRLAVPTA
jgi:hypothetical protein